MVRLTGVMAAEIETAVSVVPFTPDEREYIKAREGLWPKIAAHETDHIAIVDQLATLRARHEAERRNFGMINNL